MRDTKGSTRQFNSEEIVVPGEGQSPQRIAICTVGELFGGVERHVLGMLKSLQARSIPSLLILFHDGELAVQARGLGLGPIILSNRNRLVLRTARRLAEILQQHKICVAHIHGYKATVFCALAKKYYSFAIVKTEHGLPEASAGSLIRTWRNWLYSLSDIVATRLSGATVCYVTEDLRTYYRRAHSGLRSIVISNGVESMDRRQFPRPAEMREEWFNLLVVGRLDTVKGHHLAVEAIAANDMPPDVHLHLAGIGPRERELGALAESLGIAHQVHMLGFRRNVYDYIAHCDVLLMPSLHEGLPYTLLEAMALGTPIIASRVGGLAEVLEDGVTALLMPSGKADGLSRAIIRLYNDRLLCSRLGNAGRSLQQARYSLETMTAGYLAIYCTLTINR